ncbi:HrcA family transcriptional regulator [Campylobacter sp. RM12920]|uniref:HrcA family transcriptional regulator n=1 Tax=Campylobacter californiensis TaxID=1032243 RepID=A0ABD4JIA3_9BACT|nr:HrcA family transcriptional regulator [Campylobacter sp. RM12919]MBE2987675.1 HrcA family transcriptional regulator [Campylobacter sp. RM12920]
MNRVNKRDLILNSIIKAYLNNNSPIGSSELGSIMDVAMPASTIRVYFKKLSDEGAITQLHISSGRIPTVRAMTDYWNDVFGEINFDKVLLCIQNEFMLKSLCDKFELYCMVFGDFKQELDEILNVNNKFLLLNFTDDELVLKYDVRVEKFLKNLIGIDLDKLELVCSQVGLSELKGKIRELKRTKIYFQENEILAFKMFDDERFKMILEPSFATKMQQGLSFAPIFTEDFMGLKINVNYQDKPSTMICAGSVYSNYVKFLNQIKEVA